MIVRTYARKSRCDEEQGPETSDSQPDPYGFSSFSSQESSIWSSESDLYGGNYGNALPARKKVKKSGTATLMEAQEFGEMMELVDEVNFALEGLRRGRHGRVRSSSLLSLLGNCETAQQRRILSARGLSKKIIDAIMGLTIDESSSSVAAATLFYVLVTDAPNDYMLDSPSSVRFLIKLLNPRAVENAGEHDCKSSLRFLRTDYVSSKLDTISTAIKNKVQEILYSCKVLKRSLDDDVIGQPELNTRWIALLAIEKACSSAVSIQETPESVTRVGESFKENLRKFGGLDAIFNVAATSYSRIKERLDDKLSASWDAGRLDLQSLALILKCFKIMENATFMNCENQNHLLKMKKRSDDKGAPLSFVRLVVNAIDIFSDLSLRQNYPHLSKQGLCRRSSSQQSNQCQKRLKTVSVVNSQSQDIVLLPVKRSLPKSSFIRGSHGWISINIRKSRINSGSEPETGSSGESATIGSCSSRASSLAKDPFAFDEDDEATPSNELIVLDNDSPEDPFAFEENEVGPSNWEKLAKKKTNSSRNQSAKLSSDEEGTGVLEECLLTAVKVLMNLTNDNPEGCRQIASCDGLDALARLIGNHFPSFDFFQAVDKPSNSVGVSRTQERLGLDFLVAILGLLVNLVEKDDANRARLASASVRVSHLGGENRDVISLLCLIFLSNRGSIEVSGEEKSLSYDDELGLMQGEKEAEMMIIEAYAALLLAFLSTESMISRKAITGCLPEQKLEILVPVLERFVAFHVSLNMISPETHQIVSEVIQSCRSS